MKRKTIPTNSPKEQCGFCRPHVAQTQEILRTIKTRLIYPKKPTIRENFLIVPIRHVEHLCDLSAEEVLDIHQVIMSISKALRDISKCEGFNLFLNDGLCAGQHLPHVHFHYFARSSNEKTSPFKIMNNPDRYKVGELSEGTIQNRVREFQKIFSNYF